MPDAQRTLHLSARMPFEGATVLSFLAPRTIAGVDEVVDDGGGVRAYRRVLHLPGGEGRATLTPVVDGVVAQLVLDDADDLDAAVARCWRLFDLDADPEAIAAVLGPLAAARPGLRVPGAVDGWEVAVRAVLGQQISVAAARGLAVRLTERCGRFPTPADLVALPDDAFPMPRTRRATLRALGEAAPRLEQPADAYALEALPGIGPWTAGYVALRLGDPDVFLATDIGVLRALGCDAKEALRRAERWRPWRSYAVAQLWATL